MPRSFQNLLINQLPMPFYEPLSNLLAQEMYQREKAKFGLPHDYSNTYADFRKAPIEVRGPPTMGQMTFWQAMGLLPGIKPIDLDSFLKNKLSMELGAGDIPVKPGQKLRTYDRPFGVDMPMPQQPKTIYPEMDPTIAKGGLRDIIQEAKDEEDFPVPQAPPVHKGGIAPPHEDFQTNLLKDNYGEEDF